MVLGVCRRLCDDENLADDAFQAAFVVLARRAGDVRPTEAVRGWVYGVAVRTAREARTVSARRLARETPVPALPDRAGEVPDAPDADALRILDEEVAGLPEHLRTALLLCELEGVGRKPASERLGIPEGTLSSRLAKARKLLAERLRKRGISALAVGLAIPAQAALSPRLLARTSALLDSTAPLPAAVATISNGVLRSMLLNKLTLGSVCAILLAVACAIAWSTLPPVAAKEPPKPSPAFVRADDKKPQPQPGPRAGVLLVNRENGPFHVVDLTGKKLEEFAAPKETRPGYGVCLSPDGKRAALVVMKEERPRLEKGDDPWPFKVMVWTLGKEEPDAVHDLPADGLHLRWTADGKKIVAAKTTGHYPDLTFESVLLDPATGKEEKLDLPAGVRVIECGSDGKTFVVETYDKNAEKGKKNRVALATLGKTEPADLTDLTGLSGYPGEAKAALSPDGTSLLLIDFDPERKDAHKWGCSHRVYRVGVKMSSREPLAEFPENGRALGVAWSPDGKKIAYSWKQLHEELLKKDRLNVNDATIETEACVVVADPDGKNPKTVVSEKGPFAINPILGQIDWR
jgi:RNA polymerase sigma factor (sigma-70 family)